MLVLSRYVGDKIVLRHPDFGDIVVTLVDVDRNKVRLGFDASRDVKIFRSELLEPPPAPGADGKPPWEE